MPHEYICFHIELSASKMKLFNSSKKLLSTELCQVLRG